MVVAILISALGTHRHIPYLRQRPQKQPFSARRTGRELRETLSNRSFLMLFVSAIFAARSFIMKSVHGVGVMSATLILVAIEFPQGARPGDVDASIVASLGLIYVPAILVLYVISVAFVAAYRISRAGHEANVQRLAT